MKNKTSQVRATGTVGRIQPKRAAMSVDSGVCFYFANPHHSWERGTNENTNG